MLQIMAPFRDPAPKPPEPSVEEEFEASQRAGRVRARERRLFRATSLLAGTVAFVAVLGALVSGVSMLVEAVPLLAALGSFIFVVLVAIAGASAAVVHRVFGGARVAAIEAYERERDES